MEDDLATMPDHNDGTWQPVCRNRGVHQLGDVCEVRCGSRIGRRPILAAGNSNGDIEMLHYTGATATPSLQLLIAHDDAEREFAYTAGAERALELADQNDWTVVSMRNDWKSVFD